MRGKNPIRIAIDIDNAAFADDPVPEVARILRELADEIERSGLPETNRDVFTLRDINGNLVGACYITEETPE